MRVLIYVYFLSCVLVGIKCRQHECPYGISSLNSNIAVDTAKDKAQISYTEVTTFKDNLTENVKQIYDFIATTNLTEDQPVYYPLFTNSNPMEPYYLNTFDKQTLLDSPYDSNNPTVFVLHGFAPHPNFFNKGVIGEIKEGLLNAGDYNVIYPDYRSCVRGSYLDSVKNTYLVARNVSWFINALTEHTGTKKSNIQLIGLSLGAQMVGAIGGFTPGLGRITALDPSMPIYEDLPFDLRLSPHDAHFVDVIHTNGEFYPYGFGLYKPCGTLDFYVNGGRKQTNCNSTQPINKKPKDMTEELSRLCMHDRATDYFITSMCKGCQYIGVACESYEKYEMGLCNKYNSKTAVMGQFATKPNYPLPGYLKFFVDTDDNWPYCRNTTVPRHFV